MNQTNTALLVIDVQQGLFQKSTPIYRAEGLLTNINYLVEHAHQAGAPVFYIQHSDGKSLVKETPAWQLHSRLQPAHEDCIIYKLHGNAFEDTPLHAELRLRSITTVVVTGLVTHGCVKSTAMGAHELGYQVILVSDGHSSYSKQAAELIAEWNEKLRAQQVVLLPAAEVAFV